MISNMKNLHRLAGGSGLATLRRAPSELRKFLLVLLFVAALALASCSGDDSPAPEIEVRDSGGILMLSSSTFDFGVLAISPGTPSTETFTINNLGDADLSINGALAIGGASPTFYTVSASPAASVAAGGSTTFDILFPNASGANISYFADVTISSNDADEGSFTFGVTGIASS